MKRLAMAIGLLLLISCSGKKYTFLEGPPRLDCKPVVHFALVDHPWEYTCIVEGDIARYAEASIGIEVVYKMREEWPQRAVVGLGLKRVYNFAVSFDEQYWRDLTARNRFNPSTDELISPGDPTVSEELRNPIEGLENSLNGEFWVTIEIVEIKNVFYDNSMEIENIAKGRVMGRLDCPRCTI